VSLDLRGGKAGISGRGGSIPEKGKGLFRRKEDALYRRGVGGGEVFFLRRRKRTMVLRLHAKKLFSKR